MVPAAGSLGARAFRADRISASLTILLISLPPCQVHPPRARPNATPFLLECAALMELEQTEKSLQDDSENFDFLDVLGRDMRRLRSALFSWLASVLCLSAGGSAEAQDAIKVGVLTIRSGPAKPIGDDILAGIETATKMYGPVLNRPVELVVEESLFNAQAAVTKATKLVQQNNVASIVGTSTI